MFCPKPHQCLYVLFYVLQLQSCTSEPVLPPMLVLSSPGDLEYTDVLVKQIHDNLTLTCELRGDLTPRSYVWNYVADNGSLGGESAFTVEAGSGGSKLMKTDLQISDSGQYMCSAPPFSVTKYIIVQPRGPMRCARGAFVCGSRCVLVAYVCDGHPDCRLGEDENPNICTHNICSRPDKLNCSSGRCISSSACCHGKHPLCQQPSCCDEFMGTRDMEGYVDVEYPPLFDDRHAPDDYGFIQSTIYTVTACALIFMIAVVLLVSAICKMQMKRAALHSYSNADRATREHYSVQYHQAHRFPPCYEASRLLEQDGRPLSPSHSPAHTPVIQNEQPVAESPADPPRGFGRLSAIFSSRYRQVPTQPSEVEMTSVRPTTTSTPASPCRAPPLPADYRSPTYCDLNTEFIFTNPETPELGRDLNYMATPIEFFRRRTMRRNTLERVMDQLDRQRMTLQLGRFQLSLPRFGRSEPRPDTPNVAEINIDDLDFVRLNSNDTYTLNGRTIRLLGANFENYPVMPDGSVRPPPYTEAIRYKLYGPPPEYLSREGLNRASHDTVDQEAASNVEMPPCYDELNGNGAVCNRNRDVRIDNTAVTNQNGQVSNEVGGVVNEVVGNKSVNGNGAVGNLEINSINGTNVNVLGEHIVLNANGQTDDINNIAINRRNGTIPTSNFVINTDSLNTSSIDETVNNGNGAVGNENISDRAVSNGNVKDDTVVNGSNGVIANNNLTRDASRKAGNTNNTSTPNSSINALSNRAVANNFIGGNNDLNISSTVNGHVVNNNINARAVNNENYNAHNNHFHSSNNGNSSAIRNSNVNGISEYVIENNTDLNRNNALINGNGSVLHGNIVINGSNITMNDIVGDNVLDNAGDHVNGNNVLQNNSLNIETLSSIIDNLPAIDSDVNDELETGINNDCVIRESSNNGNCNSAAEEV